MQQVLTEYYLLHYSSVQIFSFQKCIFVSSGCPEKAGLMGCCCSCRPVFCSFSVFSLALKYKFVYVRRGILIWYKMSLNPTATTEQTLKELTGVFGIDCAKKKKKKKKNEQIKKARK